MDFFPIKTSFHRSCSPIAMFDYQRVTCFIPETGSWNIHGLDWEPFTTGTAVSGPGMAQIGGLVEHKLHKPIKRLLFVVLSLKMF